MIGLCKHCIDVPTMRRASKIPLQTVERGWYIDSTHKPQTRGERNTMTIKELADQIGTNKMNVRRTIDRLHLTDQLVRDKNGVIDVPSHVVTVVMEQYNGDTAQPARETGTPSQDATQPAQHTSTTEQALMLALEAMREQLTTKDRQLETQAQQIAAQQQTIDTLTAALSTAQALTAGSLQTLHQLTAPVTVTARTEETPNTPESVTEDRNEPQTPTDGAERPRTSGKNEDRETVAPQQEATGSPTDGAERKPEPETAPRATRKGFWSLFNRK